MDFVFVVQAALVASGRTGWHRELGLAGIALAALMVFSGILASIVSLQAGLAGPRPDVARTSAALSFSSMMLFATFIGLAIANLKRPDRHKRLMVLAAFSLLQAPIARLIRLVPAIALPERITIGAVIVDLLLFAVLLLDRRSTGRVHPVWLLGGAFIVTTQYVRVALLRTELWTNFTRWLATLGA